MAKVKSKYVCQQCGYETARYMGKCPECSSWDSLVEEVIGKETTSAKSIIDNAQPPMLIKDITVAVMGCVVNGPGEGKHADIGIAGGKDKVIIFKKGQIVCTVDEKDADKVFEEELNSL